MPSMSVAADGVTTNKEHFLAAAGISFANDVYIHNVPINFTVGVTLYAASLTKPLEHGKPQQDNIIVPSIIPSGPELKPDSTTGTVACVFVGVTLSKGKLAEARESSRQQREGNKKRKRGISVKGLEGEIDVIPFDPGALRVVAKKSGKTACFYALVNPNAKGLCTGILVPGEDVFFFQAVRDDASKSVQARKDTFGAKIRDLMAGYISGNGPAYNTAKLKWAKPEAESRITIKTEPGVAAEFFSSDPTVRIKKATIMNLLALLTNSQVTGDMGGVGIAVQILRELERPELHPETERILQLEGKFAPPNVINDEVCLKALADLTLMVPTLTEDYGLTAKELESVLTGMKQGKVSLRLDQVEPYVLAFITELRKSSATGASSGRVLTRCAYEGEKALQAMAEEADDLIELRSINKSMMADLE